MTFQIHHWRDGEFVMVAVMIGGDPGVGRGPGEPTHTRTFVEAGVLTLYPEAWDDLRELLENGMAGISIERGASIEMEIVEGKP